MCSIGMSSDYDVMVQSPHPSASSFFGNNASAWPRSAHLSRQVHKASSLVPSPLPSPPPSRRTGNHNPSLAQIGKSFSAPPRPCLVVRSNSDDSGSSSDENDSPCPIRLKKKVVFADDRGLSLTQVRLMTEPSPAPRGFWRSQSLGYIQPPQSPLASNTSPSTTAESWEITFPQPAADYLSFRKKLDTCNVSLENVIVKDLELSGTVKVKNISFNKSVFVRSTTDSWQSYQDMQATYVKNTVNSVVQVLYDTFNFRILLPPTANVIELCVCYNCESAEYWDNNNGHNYVIKKKIVDKASNQFVKSEADAEKNKPNRYTDAVQAKMDSWSEFASWHHLVNEGPYW